MLPFPAYHLESDTEETVDLSWPADAASLNLDGQYLLRGGICPPAVDDGDSVDGAMAIAGHEVRRGLAIILQEWRWQAMPDVVVDGRMVQPGAWRALADAWRHYGVRSWLWCANAADMTPHRAIAARLSGLEFGVSFRPVEFDLPLAAAKAIQAMRQGRLFVPSANRTAPDSPFLRAFAAAKATAIASPAVLAALAALDRLDAHASHWHATRRQ